MRDFWFAGAVFIAVALALYTPTHVLPVMKGLAPAPVATPTPTPHVQGHFSTDFNTCEIKPGSTYFGGASHAVMTLADENVKFVSTPAIHVDNGGRISVVNQ